MNHSRTRAIRLGLIAVAAALASAGANSIAAIDANQPGAEQTLLIEVAGTESSPIKITYDTIGTPHIEASSESAGYAGLCYAIAADRMFQMEVFRRSAQGRLSELFGAGPDDLILQQDQLFRALGLTSIARDRLKAASTRARTALQACAAGIERYRTMIADGRSPLPREFVDLGGFVPERWTAEDSLLIGVYLQTTLDMPTWQTKLTTAVLAATVGPELTLELMPAPQGGSLFDAQGKLITGDSPQTGSTNRPVALRTSFPRVTAEAAKALKLPDTKIGPNKFHGLRASNNFAVSGQTTATGKPILANDPHLMLSMPGMFYQAQLKIGEAFNVAGFLIPGLPAFLIGHNTQVSWAITYAMLDTVDVYLETIEGKQVKYRGRWVPLKERVEQFAPAGSPAVSLTVASTPHGPVLNSALPALDVFGPLALKSVVAQPEWTLNGWFELPVAKTWTDFRQALAQESIGLNFLYADTRDAFGHIGYQLAGLVPQRSLDNAFTPVPGDDGSSEWRRYARYDELPTVFDPPASILATANNRIVPDDYAPQGEPIYLSRFWDEPWRAQRATQLLAGAAQPLTAKTVAQVQLDQTNLVAQPLAKTLWAILTGAGLPAGDRDTSLSLKRLKSFDGNLAAGSAPAAVYEALTTILLRDVLQQVLGPDLYPMYAQTVFFTTHLHVLIDLLEHPRAPFFGATSAADAEIKRDQAVKNALAAADALLHRALGPNPTTWTWGGLHTLTYNHPLAAVDPVFALDPPTYPTGGDTATVNTGGWFTTIGLLTLPTDELDDLGGAQVAFAQEGLASARVVMNTADFPKSLWVNSTGASGDPLSPYWADQAKAWRAGRFFEVPFD